MRQNLDREDLDPTAIAGAMRMSVSYLHRLFRSSGMTVREHLQEMRLDQANRLLRPGQRAGLSITEVAYACGFRSSQDFSRAFRQRFGCTPSEASLVQ
jgi:AraC-like DNA-binding protein